MTCTVNEYDALCSKSRPPGRFTVTAPDDDTSKSPDPIPDSEYDSTDHKALAVSGSAAENVATAAEAEFSTTDTASWSTV